MKTPIYEPRRFQAGKLKFEIYNSRREAGKAAAQAAAKAMISLASNMDQVSIIFATGASQISMLEELTTLPGLPWAQTAGFHMDEYEGIASNHFASFRRYLREQLVERVPIREFHEIDGSLGAAEQTCHEYASALRAADPQLCLLGIGENGHLAFNDPYDANFNDPVDVRVVTLDHQCREQQVAEGWFPSVAAVPERAITLTIPTLFRVPQLVVSVPGARKAAIIRRVIEEEISNACPATLLKTHPNATVYLDEESSVEIEDFLTETI